jgi:anthranilate/para-aminobenzoate synthase component II
MGWNTISDLRTDLFKGLGNLADMESGPSVLLSQSSCSEVESGSMSHGSDRSMSQPSDVFVYFVHSFAASVCDDTIAVSENGRKFSAAMRKGNFYGAQFHPEKSGDVGEMILRNFAKL